MNAKDFAINMLNKTKKMRDEIYNEYGDGEPTAVKDKEALTALQVINILEDVIYAGVEK
jgi:hypothetical protein